MQETRKRAYSISNYPEHRNSAQIATLLYMVCDWKFQVLLLTNCNLPWIITFQVVVFVVGIACAGFLFDISTQLKDYDVAGGGNEAQRDISKIKGALLLNQLAIYLLWVFIPFRVGFSYLHSGCAHPVCGRFHFRFDLIYWNTNGKFATHPQFSFPWNSMQHVYILRCTWAVTCIF